MQPEKTASLPFPHGSVPRPPTPQGFPKPVAPAPPPLAPCPPTLMFYAGTSPFSWKVQQSLGKNFKSLVKRGGANARLLG